MFSKELFCFILVPFWGLQEKLTKTPNNFISKTPTDYYTRTSCSISNDFKSLKVFEDNIEKIWLCLDTSEAAGIKENLTKFLNEIAELSVLPLKNEISFSIRL